MAKIRRINDNTAEMIPESKKKIDAETQHFLQDMRMGVPPQEALKRHIQNIEADWA